MSATHSGPTTLRATLLALVLLWTAKEAHAAEPEHATLTYRVAPELRGCPDERAFAEAVAARLGYDPFASVAPAENSPRPVDVQIGRSAGKLEGRLTLGQTRTIQSSSCTALVDSLAATLALIFDPLGEGPAKKAPPPAEGATTAPIVPPPPAPALAPAPAPAQPPVSPMPQSSVWLALRGSLGDTPSPTVGLEFGGSFRFARAFSLLGALGASLPTSATDTGIRGSVSAFPLTLLVGLCTHFEPIFLCGAVSGGRLFASAAGTDASRSDGAFTAELAIHGGAMIPLTGKLFFRGALEGGVPLTRTGLAIDRHVLWTTAPIIGRLSLGLGIRL